MGDQKRPGNDDQISTLTSDEGARVNNMFKSRAGALEPREVCAGCDEEGCQDCCTHDDRDHGICLYCEHEEDPGEAIDRAMDFYGGDR